MSAQGVASIPVDVCAVRGCGMECSSFSYVLCERCNDEWDKSPLSLDSFIQQAPASPVTNPAPLS